MLRSMTLMTDAPSLNSWHLVRSRLVLAALVIAAPAIVTSGLLYLLFGKTVLDHSSVWSDEIAYQHQIATFVRAGFSGGYFSFEEQVAPAAVTHFSAHGPGFPVIYGSLGRLLGWHQSSGPIFNLLILAMATAAFLWMIRASHRQISAAGLVLITSWWVLIMTPVTMQESLHQSVMIVMAGFAARLIDPDTTRHGPLLGTALVILAVASVLRPTNWIAAAPLVAVGLARRPRLAVTATVVAIAGLPGFWLLWRYLSAPIPNLAIELNEIGGGRGTEIVLQHLVRQLPANIRAIFDVGQFLQRPFDQYVMFETVALAGVFVLLAVRGVAARLSRDAARRAATLLTNPSFKVDLFNALALTMALTAFVGFYFDDGSSISRVTAPFLLMSLLVLVATRCRTWMLVAAVAAQLLVAPSFVMKYRDWRKPGYTYDRSAAAQFQREVSPLMAFAEGQGPWCNTLLTNNYHPEIAFVPAGIGLTVGEHGEDLATPIKSKYLLIAGNADAYGEKTRLRHLGATMLGNLYLNLDAACP
jgi:hypothetical protein